MPWSASNCCYYIFKSSYSYYYLYTSSSILLYISSKLSVSTTRPSYCIYYWLSFISCCPWAILLNCYYYSCCSCCSCKGYCSMIVSCSYYWWLGSFYWFSPSAWNWSCWFWSCYLLYSSSCWMYWSSSSCVLNDRTRSPFWSTFCSGMLGMFGGCCSSACYWGGYYSFNLVACC